MTVTLKRHLIYVFLLLLIIGNGGCKAETIQNGISQPNAFPPSFLVDGVLYCSTGVEVDIDEDKSERLGEITSVGDAFKKPTQNGQANIAVKDAPYVKHQDGIALLWDGKWILFEARSIE